MWFLLIPPVALFLAAVWVALRSRPDRTTEAMITIAGYRRSMAALARPIPAQPRPGVGYELDDSDYSDPPPFDDPRDPFGVYALDDPYALNQLAEESPAGEENTGGHERP